MGIRFRNGNSTVLNTDTRPVRYVLTELIERNPQPRYVFVEVPGADGALNLSRAVTGSITLTQRTVEIGLAILGADHGASIAEYDYLVSRVHGRLLRVLTPDTDRRGGWWYGEVAVGDPEYIGEGCLVTVTCTCDPALQTE